jgi:DNA-binding MarR family transcriptional regulator
MKQKTSGESSFELWRLIGRVNHLILLRRQRELRQHHIPVRQLHVLVTIRDLGPMATLSEVAKRVEREMNVISMQTSIMEKDGLITRIKNTPKSNLLTLELTDKGREIINKSRKSKSIEDIFSSLSTEECQQLESTLNKVLTKAQKYTSV